MSNRKVVITNGNGEEVRTVEIKNNEVDKTLDACDGWVLANLGDDETESLEWRLVMAEHHNKRLSHENAALRESFKLKELERDTLILSERFRDSLKLVEANESLRETLRLKEAECEALASDISRIVSAAADAHLSGSEQQHVDHLYRVIHDSSGKLYNDDSRGDDENQQAD